MVSSERVGINAGLMGRIGMDRDVGKPGYLMEQSVLNSLGRSVGFGHRHVAGKSKIDVSEQLMADPSDADMVGSEYTVNLEGLLSDPFDGFWISAVH